MQGLFRLSDKIGQIALFTGAVFLSLLVLVTMLDVTTRYIFRLTEGASGFVVKGGIELVTYFMLFTLLSAFVAYIERSQIIVDILTTQLPEKFKAILMGIFLFIFALTTIIMVWGLYESAQDAMRLGNTTQDLRIPMTPIYGIAGVLCVMLMLRSFIESLRVFVTGKYYDAESLETENAK